MDKRIVVVGAGAIGGYTGGNLAHNGFDVTLVDPWPEHVETIRRDGLSLEGVSPEESVVARPKALHLTELQHLSKERPIDIVELSRARLVARARAYLVHIDGAISGQHGHNHTMRVAGILIQKFGLTIDEALPLILEWNQRCEPPWSEKELLHKLQDAYRLRFEYARSGQS